MAASSTVPRVTSSAPVVYLNCQQMHNQDEEQQRGQDRRGRD